MRRSETSVKRMEGANQEQKQLLTRSLVNYIWFLWLITMLPPPRGGSAQQRYHSHRGNSKTQMDL